MKAKDVMSTGVIPVTESTSIEEAARTMLTHRISGLPVTGKDGSLVGMISEGDLLRRSELATERKRPKGSNSSWGQAACPRNTPTPMGVSSARS